MKFDLKTLDNYDDSNLISELKRVSKLVEGLRLTMTKFDEFSKVHSSTVRNRFGGWSNALAKAGLSVKVSPQARQISREKIVDLLKEVAKKLGTDSLTIKQFIRETGIGQKAILARFKSWHQVLKESGLSPVALGRRYSEEECFENILKLWTHYGRQPHYSELKLIPSDVGPKAYIIRWGSWRKALRAFVNHMESSERSYSNQEKAIPLSTLNQRTTESTKQIFARSISLSVRYKVLKRDNFRCVRCGRSPANTLGVELHVDHKTAWSRGGTNEISNLQTLCSKCNLGKGVQ